MTTSAAPTTPTTPTAAGAPAPAPRRRGTVAVAAAVLAAALLGGAGGAAVVSATTDDPAGSASTTTALARTASAPAVAATGSVEQVAAQVLPSVVSVEVAAASGGGEGTGVVVREDGLIMTNNHVVAGAAAGGSLRVTFNDGTTAPASLVGRDPVTDIAILRAEDVSGLTPATLGRSADLAPGQQVVAIGSPLGLQGTVTSGIISAVNRPVRTGGDGGAETASTVIDAVQTDAAINPGNSGGPLVNLRGEVVGINSAIATLGAGVGGRSGSIGLGFAIPIDQARAIATELVDSGTATHAQLAVTVTDATAAGGPEGTTGSGAVIADVTPGGAADAAGLRAGDVVTRVGDRRLEGADSLIAAIRSHRPGDEVALSYRRDGAEHTVRVTLGSDG